MTDEKYLYKSDIAEKKRISHGAHNKRTHNGKGGCKLPHEYLTKKERDAMNGAVNQYNLGKPMTIKQLRKLPEDLQREYLSNIINKKCCTRGDLVEMLQTSITTFNSMKKSLGVFFPRDCRCRRKDPEFEQKRAEFRMWAGLETTVGNAKRGTSIEPDTQPQAEPQQYIESASCAPVRCVSKFGNMTFEGDVSAIADEVVRILGGRQLKVTVLWEEMHE